MTPAPFTDRHRKVLHDFYHLDIDALRDLVNAGLIDLTILTSPQLPLPPIRTYPNPLITEPGFEQVKELRVID